MAGNRSSFAIYRHGESDVVATLSPGFLLIYNRSLQPQDSLRNVRSTSGQVDFSLTGSTALRVDDLLKDTRSGRWYLVIQLVEMDATRRALIAEVDLPIPDEFESGVIDKWWTASGGWTIDGAVGELKLSGTDLVASNILAIEHLSQIVEGEFDVYASLKADTGTGSAKRYALLKASNGDLTDGVAVGIVDDGTPRFCRIDYVDALGGQAITEAGDLLTGSFRYVRLKREGNRFRCFWANATAQPRAELEWSEIQPSSWTYTRKESVTVGPAGFVSGTASIQLRWKFFRNWKDSLRQI